jgi:uncharacterized membrane protein
MAHHPAHAKDAFSSDALERVAATIAEVEKATSAEIRISILDERDTDDSSLTVEQLAKKEFASMKMDQTKYRSGVLLLILYSERKYYVYGDTGIHKRLKKGVWDTVASTLSKYFSNDHFEEGLHQAVREIGRHLETAIPPEADNTDQLSNEVAIR